jgi:hypothetical protein
VVSKARASSTTGEKSKAPRKPKKANNPSPSSSETEGPGSIETLVESPLGPELSLVSRESSPLCPLMSLCLDDLGINFFFTHYVTLVSNLTSGKIEPVSQPMWSSLYADKTIHDAVSSVGFAGLSNVTKNPSHMAIARNKYVTTLGRINAALQDPDSMVLAETFKAVLLLAAFEVKSQKLSCKSLELIVSCRLLEVALRDHGLCILMEGPHC